VAPAEGTVTTTTGDPFETGYACFGGVAVRSTTAALLASIRRSRLRPLRRNESGEGEQRA
jgi:hypothetical protein